MKRKSKKKDLKQLWVFLSVLAAISAGVLYREYSRPTSQSLIKTAYKACDDQEGAFKEICAYMKVMQACQVDQNGKWLDLKVCGIVGR